MGRKKYRTKDVLNPNLTVKQFCEAKIEMLEKDMAIMLTDKQKAHFRKLENEIQIDNYARKIIFDACGD
jgi:hypothetical protein